MRMHHECQVCWVTDCDRCRVPMVVWKTHGTEPPEADLDHMMLAVADAADGVRGPGRWRLDTQRRSIPDHWHAHAR